VFRRLQLLIAFIACLISTGVQWDVLQVFAWGRMIIGYANTMSLSEAVEETFDGEMCELCKVVNEAKQQEQTIPEQSLSKQKFLLICPASSVFVSAPLQSARWLNTSVLWHSHLRGEPPLPPPRAA
jgi:hypothetical protein